VPSQRLIIPQRDFTPDITRSAGGRETTAGSRKHPLRSRIGGGELSARFARETLRKGRSEAFAPREEGETATSPHAGMRFILLRGKGKKRIATGSDD